MGIIKVPSPNATAPQKRAGCTMGIIKGEWWLPHFLRGGGHCGCAIKPLWNNSKMPRKTRPTTNAKMGNDDIVSFAKINIYSFKKGLCMNNTSCKKQQIKVYSIMHIHECKPTGGHCYWAGEHRNMFNHMHVSLWGYNVHKSHLNNKTISENTWDNQTPINAISFKLSQLPSSLFRCCIEPSCQCFPQTTSTSTSTNTTTTTNNQN